MYELKFRSLLNKYVTHVNTMFTEKQVSLTCSGKEYKSGVYGLSYNQITAVNTYTAMTAENVNGRATFK